ncbi:hypothetical protein [Ilumatobacter sp.]|uniref:hypothetical protein n=1 Tax=Ilumatobacter sp. TaxID=1967498 RepID=UPI003C64951F
MFSIVFLISFSFSFSVSFSILLSVSPKLACIDVALCGIVSPLEELEKNIRDEELEALERRHT